MQILEIKNVTKKFGGLVALDNVSVSVERGTILGLIGPNGSGKTTLFNVITGFLKPDSGSVRLKGENITSLKPHQIAQRGLCKTFQLTRVFSELTVLENLLVVSPEKKKSTAQELARERLNFFDLSHLENEKAGNLSFGQQKLVELARSLTTDPEVILLDEPAAGINPVLLEKIIQYLMKLRDIDITMIVIEHHLSTVFRLADEIVVLNHGEKIASGSPHETKQNPEVIKAYLGTEK